MKIIIIKRFLLGILIFCGITNTHATSDVWEVLRGEFKLDHEVSREEVQAQIRWLIAHPGYLQKTFSQSQPYIYHIVTEIKKRNLPGELALIPMIESSFNPFAYSVVGAAGLWQLMPGTGKDFGIKQDWWFDGRRSIDHSTDAALNYLAYLNKFFDGNWTLSIASYDAGEGTISRAIKAAQQEKRSPSYWDLSIPRETQIYVPRLLAFAEIVKNAEQYKLTIPPIPYQPYFQEVNIGSQIDLNHAAKLAGISYRELIKLNPGYNHWTTAPYKPFKLLIPTEKVRQFNLNLANFPEDKRVSWTKHQVQEGDNLDSIATRYHTTVNLIKQLNQLTTNQVKINQSILIPSTRNAPLMSAPSPKQEIALVKTTYYGKPSQHNVPTPAPTAPASAFAPAVGSHRMIHIVQIADSYQRLEKMYGVNANDILTWNKLSSDQRLQVGQQLIIWKTAKPVRPYIVQNGDTLDGIAKRHKLPVNQILSLNPGLQWNTPLYIGQKILIG